MHVTELTQELIAKLKEHIEINSEGHILTKKKNITQMNQPEDHKVKQFSGTLLRVGDTRTKIGRRRGAKTKYGQTFGFTFPETKEKITCKAREIVWILNNGIYDPKMKVQPKNGDIFDDRIENLHLVKSNNGRPVGARDKKKRAKRDGLNTKQEAKVTKLRKDGLTVNQITEIIGTTYSVVSSTLDRERRLKRIKPFFDSQTFKGKVAKDGWQIGVYILYASPLDSKNFISKGYVGSSRTVWKRLRQHFKDLKKGGHYNKQMQAAYSSGNYIFNAFWLERGEFDHGEALALETEHINKYERASLFNKWSQPPFEVIKPFLDKLKSKISEENYTVDENGCWNWKRKHVSGYSKEIPCSIDGTLKHVKPHRLSYYKTYGEYPELIRHMCDNRLCVNPDHLKKGSHQQNGLDKSREFRKQFEYWWLRYTGDVAKLTDHFGFKHNQSNGSSQIYYWENQLGLRETYPDIGGARQYRGQSLEQIEERKVREGEKEQKKQQKKERYDYVESLRQTVHNLTRRYQARKIDLQNFLCLSPTESRRLLSDLEPVNLDAVWTISESYGTYEEKCLHAKDMIKNHPDLKRDIEDCYAREVFKDEWEAYRCYVGIMGQHHNRTSLYL